MTSPQSLGQSGEGKKPSPRELSDDKLNEIENYAEWLEYVIGSQSVNGLFHTKALMNAKITSEDCYAFIKTAREAIKNAPVTYEDSITARSALDSGWEKIDDAIETAGFWYKFQYIYAVPAFILALVYFSILILLAFRFTDISLFNILPSAVLIAGSMGALLRCIWRLIRDLELREYVKSWITQLVLAPFLGALLSLGVYVAYYFVSAASSRPPQAFDISSLLLSLIAGYGWRETVDLLTNFTKATIGSILRLS
jgi:hypothetical protein